MWKKQNAGFLLISSNHYVTSSLSYNNIAHSQAQGKMEPIYFIQWQKTFKRHCILVTLAHFWMVSFVFFSIAYTVSCSLSKLPCLFCRENNWWRILIPQNNDAIAAIKVLALLTVHVSLCSTDFEGVGS